MLLSAIPTWLAVLIVFTSIASFWLMAFALSHAKRDVTIDITLINLK